MLFDFGLLVCTCFPTNFMDQPAEAIENDAQAQAKQQEQNSLCRRKKFEKGVRPPVVDQNEMGKDDDVIESEPNHQGKCAVFSSHENGHLVEQRNDDNQRMADMIQGRSEQMRPFGTQDQSLIEREKSPEQQGHCLKRSVKLHESSPLI